MTQQKAGSENLDMVLGNPSTQKILRLLSIHLLLSVQEIKSLSNISESQIHLTLKNMVESKLVKRSSRGVYELSQSAFTKLLLVSLGSDYDPYFPRFLFPFAPRCNRFSEFSPVRNSLLSFRNLFLLKFQIFRHLSRVTWRQVICYNRLVWAELLDWFAPGC